jgi:CRISPR-associated endonuclease/helicase Cas3
LIARDVPVSEPETATIGRADLIRLFDTAPDPSGDDADIAPFVTDADDLDVEVAWAWWTPGEDGAPDPDIWVPAAEYRCRVPIGAVVAYARDRAVWRFDRSAGGWTRVADQPSRPRPGDVLLVSAADGGYHPDTGFDPSAPGPVPDSPELLTFDARAERAALAAAEAALADQRPLDPGAALLADAARATEASLAEADAARATEASLAEAVDDRADEQPRRWQSLDEHSEQVRDQAAALLAVLAPALSLAAARSAIVAGYLHDLGKAHEIWQDAICALADDEEQAQIAAGRPWAKSGRDGPLLFAGDVAFRHELASLLFIDGPLTRLLSESPDPDLTRYLVLAHHGKLRVHVREHDDVIRGLRQGATTPVPAMLGQPASTLTVDLAPFLLDDDRSWTQTVRTLLDRYGPFVLAYLETIVRVADWRASGARELPTP